MPVTKEDIRREHIDAMARLDEAQQAALKRINRAFREARFGNRSAKEMMEKVYEDEARARNAAKAG